MMTICKRLGDNKTAARLNRHVHDVHHMTITNLQEAHRKYNILFESANNQNMREARDEIRRLGMNFDRLNDEYDYITSMYQDQMRLNSEQENRIDYLEKKLKDYRNSKSASRTLPFTSPASLVTFARTPRRIRTAVATSSPLSREVTLL